jgi:hypothetical protein
MAHPDENIEQEDNEDPFVEGEITDPADEKIAEIPPEFEDDEEEEDNDEFDEKDEEL